MELKLLNGNDQAAGKVDAPDTIFGRDYNEALIHQLVVAFQANARTADSQQKNEGNQVERRIADQGEKVEECTAEQSGKPLLVSWNWNALEQQGKGTGHDYRNRQHHAVSHCGQQLVLLCPSKQ